VIVLTYALITLASSLAVGLLGFLVGRCGRRLPIIDNNLPWTMHRGQVPPMADGNRLPPGPARWPQS